MRIQLSLKNWRSVEDAVVEGEPLTVLVGRNASGKSNVVDALAFLAEARTDLEGAVRRRGGIERIRRQSPTKHTLVEVGVEVQREQRRFSHHLSLRVGTRGTWGTHREEIRIEEGGETALHIEREWDHFTVTGPVPIGSEPLKHGAPRPKASIWPLVDVLYMGGADTWTDLSVLVLAPSPVALRQPQPLDEGDSLAPDASNLAAVIRRLQPRQAARIVERLRLIVPGLVGVHTDASGRYLHLEFVQETAKGRRTRFLGSDMSDGSLRALAIIVATERMRPGELLIMEEPEAHVHPGAAGVLYEALEHASRHGSVWITTHSPELLERAPAESIRVCEYDEGVTRVGPLSAGQREILARGLYTAAELMRIDELRREGGPVYLVADG